MEIMRRYDDWCITKVKIATEFLNDWLGISQKIMERVVIVCNVIARSCLLSSSVLNRWEFPVWFEALMVFVFFNYIYRLHRTPCAARSKFLPMRTSRMWWQSLTYLSILPSPANDWLVNVGLIGGYGAVTLIEYLVCVDIDGERGRKAKMAWNKVIELFGTRWIPQPVGVRG